MYWIKLHVGQDAVIIALRLEALALPKHSLMNDPFV